MMLVFSSFEILSPVSRLVREQKSYSIERVDFVDGVVGEELCVLLDVLHHLLRLIDEHGPGAGHVTPV